MGLLNFIFGKKGTEMSVVGSDEAFSAAWLRPIISDLTDAVVAYDEDFKILILNKDAEQLFGVGASEVVGRVVSLETGRETKLKFLVQVMFPSLAPSVVSRSEEDVFPQVADLNFDDVNLRVTTNRIVDATGRVQGFVKIIRNRTREVQVLKSKGEFLTVAAHQLRTPLTAINWAFGGLKKDAAIGPESRELIDTGSLASEKLLKIVDDLLNAAQLEEGKFSYQFQEADLGVFLDKLVYESGPVAKEYDVSVFLEKPEQPVAVTFDEQKLGIAISNLVDNAIKYNVSKGTVTVALRPITSQPYVEVSVKDTGVGVPPDAIQKLFTKFFRAENVMQFETEGSGLGLFVVKNIIERHGGKIWVESELNRGTTFHFTLPTDARLIPQKELVRGDEE